MLDPVRGPGEVDEAERGWFHPAGRCRLGGGARHHGEAAVAAAEAVARQGRRVGGVWRSDRRARASSPASSGRRAGSGCCRSRRPPPTWFRPSSAQARARRPCGAAPAARNAADDGACPARTSGCRRRGAANRPSSARRSPAAPGASRSRARRRASSGSTMCSSEWLKPISWKLAGSQGWSARVPQWAVAPRRAAVSTACSLGSMPYGSQPRSAKLCESARPPPQPTSRTRPGCSPSTLNGFWRLRRRRLRSRNSARRR